MLRNCSATTVFADDLLPLGGELPNFVASNIFHNVGEENQHQNRAEPYLDKNQHSFRQWWPGKTFGVSKLAH